MNKYSLITKLCGEEVVKLYKNGKLIKEFDTVIEAIDFADKDAGICRKIVSETEVLTDD